MPKTYQEYYVLDNEEVRENNPLAALLMDEGFTLHGASVVTGSYYMLAPSGERMIYVHPKTTGMAVDAFPVEIIA